MRGAFLGPEQVVFLPLSRGASCGELSAEKDAARCPRWDIPARAPAHSPLERESGLRRAEQPHLNPIEPALAKLKSTSQDPDNSRPHGSASEPCDAKWRTVS